MEDMPFLDFALFDKPGYAMADITGLVESSERFVGEVKLIEPLLPCGKTPSQREVEWNAIWKAFRKEERRGLHKTRSSIQTYPAAS